MTRRTIKSKKGFTIIEVVLVLAIAGLIFLMVFIALPALQSSQRNTQREDDLARMLTAVTDYQSNNSGQTPFGTTAAAITENKSFVKRYIDDTCPEAVSSSFTDTSCSAAQFRDPDGATYKFVAAKPAAASATADTALTGLPTQNDHNIYVAINATCSPNEGSIRKGTGPRQIAMIMVLEGGGITCNDNQ